jgi:hypothetical protein
MHWIDGEADSHRVFGMLHKVPFFTGLDVVSLIHICAKMNVVTARRTALNTSWAAADS